MVWRRSTTVRHAILALVLATTVLCAELQATITTPGDVDPAYEGSSDPWLIDLELILGGSGFGELTIGDGASVTAGSGYIGLTPEGQGEATVSGLGSWTLAGELIVGVWGQGSLIVSDGGQVAAGALVIGGADANDWAGEMVGLFGDPNGTGSVLVTDANSVLEVTGEDGILVGYRGAGALEIRDGARVTSPIGIVGVTEGGVGSVTVDGVGSRWTITGDEASDLTAQGEGELIVSNGAFVVVRDPNGLLDVAGTVRVGSGEGVSIVGATNGGRIYSDVVQVGALPDSTGAIAAAGVGAEWENSGSVFVGGYGLGALVVGLGGVMDVNDTLYLGGFDPDQFDVDTAEIGYEPNGEAEALVMGEGSTLRSNSLYVGYSGEAYLSISGGARVESETAGIALLPGSEGEVVVTGVDANDVPTTWENTDAMAVGGYGTGSLTISDGAEVLSDLLYIGGFNAGPFPFDANEIGYDPNGSGAVIVTGEGSSLDAVVLLVGAAGEGYLSVEDGAGVVGGLGIVGFGPDANGVALVDGGSTWSLSDVDEENYDWSMLSVGVFGPGSLTIAGGSQVTVQNATLGGSDLDYIDGTHYAEVWGDAQGDGTVLVTGAGSLFDARNTLVVGYSGTGALTVEAGGRVTSEQAMLGAMAGTTGTALVTGAGSEWVLANDLYIGVQGTGSLTIRDGGVITTDDDGHIGWLAGSTGSVLVTGEGSVWEVGDDLVVGGDDGAAGGAGELFVTDGGEVFVGDTLMVRDTGLLGGDGTITVASLWTLHNFGTIAPGDEGIGTLTVNGSVVFHEGSTYAVDINSVDSDRLVVDGEVTIAAGTVRINSESTLMGEHEYEIIRADSVVGEFNDVDTALLDFSFSDAGLDYNDTSVLLHVTAADFDDPNIARTDNQRAVGGALQGIGQQGGNDVTNRVQDLPTEAGVRDAYDQLSGRTRPALAPMTVAGTSGFLGTVSGRVQTVRTGAVAGAFDSRLMAAGGPDQALGGSTTTGGQTFAVGNGSRLLPDRRWGLWGRGYGLYGDRDGGSGAPGYGYHVYGAGFGVDYQFTESLLAGLVAGMSEGDANYDDSRDTTDFGAAHIGLYGSATRDRWSVDSVLTYAKLDYETRRFVDLLDERLVGNFDGSELAAYVEVRREYELAPNLSAAPLASLQYTHLDLDSYTETGGTGALAFDGQTHESVRGSLGARLTRRLIETAGDFRADAQLRGRWVHEFGDDRANVDTSFAGDPTAVFTIRDDAVSRDSAALGLGLRAELNERTRANFDYDTRLSSDESVHVLSASLQYRW